MGYESLAQKINHPADIANRRSMIAWRYSVRKSSSAHACGPGLAHFILPSRQRKPLPSLKRHVCRTTENATRLPQRDGVRDGIATIAVERERERERGGGVERETPLHAHEAAATADAPAFQLHLVYVNNDHRLLQLSHFSHAANTE